MAISGHQSPSQRRYFRWFFTAASFVAVIIGFFAVRLFYNCYRTIDGHLENHKWSIPATVYASSPVLYPGHRASRDWLLDYLERLEYQRTESTDVHAGHYFVAQNKVVLRKNLVFRNQEADFPVAIHFDKNGVEKIEDISGRQQFSSYALEPVPITNLFGDHWEKRHIVSLDEIPAHLKHAVLAIEDRRFYSHSGIDARAILRAFWNNLNDNTSLQGASTITQQLAKNLYLTPERSLRRKISEAVMALMMETKLDKGRILELYLNEIYFGQRGPMSINGVGAASRLFFRKQVNQLTVQEAALLAGMIRAPANYNPYRHPADAKARRDAVLLAMQESGFIEQSEYQRARRAPVTVYPFDTRVNLAPYFGDLVKQQLLEKYKAEDLYQKNLHVFSTIDLDLQEAAESALADGLKKIDRVRYRNVKKQVQGSLIAIEPQTGYIRAFVGGRSYSRSQFDRITRAARQPGSAFKPIVYATALEMSFLGIRYYTPAALIADEPAEFQIHKAVWKPKNYDGRFYGLVTMRSALANSLNVSTAKLAQHVGLQQIVSVARAFGLDNVKPYPSLALGAFEVSPWQLASAYTVLANYGVKAELRAIERVSDVDGRLLEGPKIEKRQVIHPQTAYLVTDMLKTVMTEGTAASSRRLGFLRPAAGKTGTTDDFRDAWFVGYTPDLICLVWTGYDDNSPLRMNGAQAALPIWANFMRQATARMKVTDFDMPQGIVTRVIDPSTGKLAAPFCVQAVPEIFIQGSEPVDACTEYDHFTPEIIEFSDDRAKVKQVIPDPVYQVNLEGEARTITELRDEELDEMEPREHIYFAPAASGSGGVYTNYDVEDDD